jgi:glycosyltransferase involved in cell wall biosynthesis
MTDYNIRNKENGTDTVHYSFFSVVIATYNRAELLKRALESLILQTEKEWDAIIVDDGSTVDTYKQILPYLESFPAIKYFSKSHSGIVPTKNQGIRLSEGKFITFLDSDDEYHPSHLEIRKQFLIRNPDIRFLYGGAEIIGNQYVPDKDDPSARINLRDCMIGGTFVIERETLLSLNGFGDITLGSDFDLCKRARERKIPMTEIETSTYIYHRENPDSVTNRMLGKVKNV